MCVGGGGRMCVGFFCCCCFGFVLWSFLLFCFVFAFFLTFGIFNSFNLLFFHFEIISNLQKIIRILQKNPMNPLLTKFSPFFHILTHLFSLSVHLTFIPYTSIQFTYVFKNSLIGGCTHSLYLSILSGVYF